MTRVQGSPLVGGERAERVGWGFIGGYALAYTGYWLGVMAPVVVTLSLKVTALVGTDAGPGALSLVAGVGALLAMVGQPIWGKVSDRTASRWGMRRPWMVLGVVGGLVAALTLALAPNLPMVLLGFCLYQFFFNATGATLVAVLPDQVPEGQRGVVSGILGVCLPVGLIGATYLVQLVSPDMTLMFLLPAVVAVVVVVAFAAVLKDRRLEPAHRPAFSARELASTFYVNPRRNPDFGWTWASRFLFILAYAFLTTYQTFFLLRELGSSEAEVPHQVFLATLVLSVTTVVASLLGGKLSDLTHRRKIFVLIAAVVYGLGLFVAAGAGELDGFLVAMAIAGFGFGAYLAVDLALVADVLPDPDGAASKDMGVFNIANTLPQSVAPAIAPIILAVGGGSFDVLFGTAGVVAVVAALIILLVRRVR
jgi:MFS family permease